MKTSKFGLEIIIEPRSDDEKLEPLGHFWHAIWLLLLRFIVLTLYHQKPESYETQMPDVDLYVFILTANFRKVKRIKAT